MCIGEVQRGRDMALRYALCTGLGERVTGEIDDVSPMT